jgi:hypothetical protein
MKPRTMKQFGWITGPVECRCNACDWNVNFVAVDSSIPVSIAAMFAAHKCADYAPLFFTEPSQTSIMRHDD